MDYTSEVIGEIRPSPGRWDDLVEFLTSAGYHVERGGWLETFGGADTGFDEQDGDEFFRGVGDCSARAFNAHFVATLRAAADEGLIEFADLIREGQAQRDFEHYLYEHEQWFTDMSLRWLVPHGLEATFEKTVQIFAHEALNSAWLAVLAQEEG